jgi:hypothetical protein
MGVSSARVTVARLRDIRPVEATYRSADSGGAVIEL